jgi:hypothetical protein
MNSSSIVAQEFLRCFMDELHSEMHVIQFYPDGKHRTKSSCTESNEMPLIIPKYGLLHLH